MVNYMGIFLWGGGSESGRCGQEVAIQKWSLRQVGLYVLQSFQIFLHHRELLCNNINQT